MYQILFQSLHNSSGLPAAKKNIPRTIGISNLAEEGSPLLSSHPLLYARIPGNRLKVRQSGVLFPIPQLAFAGNRRVKELKRVRAAGKSTREIRIRKIPGVLCPS
jgi:hypothetical protein